MIKMADLIELARVPNELHQLFLDEEPWRALERLDGFASTITDNRQGDIHPTAVLEGAVTVMPGAVIGPYAYISGPAFICSGAQVGHTAYLRGPVVLGPKAQVGHSSEVKRSIFLGGARAPHFNYVGDSLIGHDVNLGAGVKLANFKAFGDEITINGHSTGARKLGALLGDGVSIGCNAVLAPGTIVGAKTIIYHGATVRGVVPGGSIVKFQPDLTTVERRTT